MKTKEKKIRILMIAFLTATLFMPSASFAQDQKPNILLILTDNTGWGDLGPYGGGALRGAPSPRIDKLAKEGLVLQNFNTEPQCVPARSALMSGRHAIRSGTQSVPIGTEFYGLVPWEVTIAEAMSDEGYATAAFGKWHLGKTPGRFPTDQGFDYWYGIPNTTDEALWATPQFISGATDVGDINLTESQKPWIMESRRGEKPKNVKLYDIDARRLIDEELTLHAIEFMKESKAQGKPFFAFVPLTATHFPNLPHPDFAGKSGHGDYTDMLMQTDHYVGQMLDALEELGISDNTLFVFTADNGSEHPDNGDGQYNGWNGPWAGTYFTAMEGGLRAPCIVRWPEKMPAGRVSNEIVHIVDLFPTIAALTGAKVPTDRAIDGIDMSDFFLGKKETSGREGFVIYVGDDLRAMKWRNWKWHFAWQETKYDPIEQFSTVPKIVNLIRDPRETRQVAEPYNGWLQFPFMEMLTSFQASVQRYPNVPMGAKDDYAP